MIEMKESEYKEQLGAIAKEVASLLYFCWKGSDLTIANSTKADYETVAEGLKNLSLVFKYQQFDLEATKREIEHLKSLLGRS